MIDLNPHHLETVRKILAQHVPECEVRAFGSRVNWTAKDYSDLDLAVVGSGELSDDTLRRLKEAFEESDLPFRVDVLDWHGISPSFQKVIEKEYEVIRKAKSESAVGEWRHVTIGDIASNARNALVGGPFGSNLVSDDYVSHGIPVIRGQNMAERWVSGEFAYVTTAKAASLGANLACPGDIVFTQRGTLGQVSIVPEGPFDRYLISQSQMKLTVDRSRADPLFIYYVFRSPVQQKYIQQHAIQTGVPHTNLGILRETLVPLPAMQEQRAIAHVLGTLDDKIELNRRMNETLEAMARAIFRSWFVDFDPVRAKAEGRWKPGQSLPGLSANTWDLWPDSFQDSPIGKAPKGWRVASLGEEVEATRGLSYTGKGLAETGFPLHNLNSVLEGGGYKYEGIKHYIGEYEERHLVRPGDLIVTNTEQGFDFLLIGYPAIVPKCYGDIGLFSHHLFRVRPRPSSPIKVHFLYWLLMSQVVRAQIVGCTNGTTVNMLAPDGLERPRFALPPLQVIDAFERVARPIQLRAEQNHEESMTLTHLRDALLPKLISGEIRAKGVEQVATEHGLWTI